MTHEEWRDVVGFEGLYEVSNLGNVRSKDRHSVMIRYGKSITRFLKGQPLKQQTDKYGYKYVNIGGKNRKVHRLVMEAFVGKSDLTVNHRDEDKSNNKLDNLEYMTSRDNLLYGTGMDRRRIAARRRGRPVEQIDMTTGEVVKRYKVLVDVDKDGFCSQNVGKACMGKILYSGGYYWRYADA